MYNNGYQPYQMPTMPQMPNYYDRLQQIQRPQTDLIRVTGMSGAQAYQMMGPNSTVALFDANSDLMYIKSTDGAGFATIRTFEFKPHDDPAPASVEYATKADLMALKEEILSGKQSIRKQSARPDAAE